MDKVETVFDLLDRWRRLPSYQLERRADIFFAYYLPEILPECLMEKLTDELQYKLKDERITHDNIIPEFPLLKSSFEDNYDGKRKNDSRKVDYVVFGNNMFYLIELKTDMNSLDNPTQKRYMAQAKNKKLSDLIRDIEELANSQSKGPYKDKYAYLTKQLHDQIERLNKVGKKPEDLDKVAIYIQPDGSIPFEEGYVITFKDVAKCLEKYDSRFSDSLRKWILKQ
ncbi:MAG: hypothetical protein FWG53_00180 [Clostridiales bacterium]|nr:hypothetical protein [Clostridiales bacterium]